MKTAQGIAQRLLLPALLAAGFATCQAVFAADLDLAPSELAGSRHTFASQPGAALAVVNQRGSELLAEIASAARTWRPTSCRAVMPYGVVDQLGHGNSAWVSQAGSFNNAEIDQFGSDNTAHVSQRGNGNQAQIEQFGSGHGASVDQRGSGLTVMVRQYR